MFSNNLREMLSRNSNVNFFDGFGLQYSRMNLGGFARNTLVHYDFASLFFCDFRYLTWLMAGVSFQFIAGILGRLNFFLNLLFSSTLLSRFLRSSFFVGSNFGLNYKIYSHLFWKKNRVIFRDDSEFDSCGELSRFKGYLLRTTANTFVGDLSFSIAQQFSALQLSGNFTAGLGGKAAAALTRASSEVFFYGNGGVLFNYDVDGALCEDSFAAKSCIFVARRGVTKQPLPIFLARLSNRRVVGSLVRSKNGSIAGLVAVLGRRFRAKYFTRLLNAGLPVRSQNTRFMLFKRITGSFCGQYLRGMLRHRAPVFIAAATLHNYHETNRVGLARLRPVLSFERRNLVSFLKRLVGVVDLTFFRTLRASKSYCLAYNTYKQDCSKFLVGIRGIRPLKLFAHAKRIGLWPKNLKLWPVRARHKQPPFKLITYRHSRAVLLKSNKVKMPPGIFSRENYESMNLIWDFPHQNYKFARVNAFQHLRA